MPAAAIGRKRRSRRSTEGANASVSKVRTAASMPSGRKSGTSTAAVTRARAVARDRSSCFASHHSLHRPIVQASAQESGTTSMPLAAHHT
jgi:hypothetical protein